MDEFIFNDEVILEYYNYVKSKKRLSINELTNLLIQNDDNSKKMFMDSYLYYVFVITMQLYKKAKKYVNFSYSFMDFIQEGNLLLMEMLNKNNYDSFNLFEYAFYSRMTLIFEKRIKPESPGFKISRLININHIQEDYWRKFHCDIPISELSRLTGFSEGKISFILGYNFQIDKMSDEDLSGYIGYYDIEDEVIEDLMQYDSIELLRTLLECLPCEQRDLLIKLFGLFGEKKEKYYEISRQFGICVRSVYSLKDKAIEKIRSDNKRLLKQYID